MKYIVLCMGENTVYFYKIEGQNILLSGKSGFGSKFINERTWFLNGKNCNNFKSSKEPGCIFI